MWFIVFATPLSFNLEIGGHGGIGMYLPTDPLMFGVMLLFFFKLFYHKKYDIQIFKHPVTIAIVINLIWLLFTSITSSMPVVSFKFLLARLWFVVCFYFLATQLFKNYKNYKIYFWSYIIPLIAVIFYSVIRLSIYSFDEKASHWVMSPFYKDHTSYGAALAMYFPILFIFLFKKNTALFKLITFSIIAIFVVGIIFSYTRAAWLSLFAAVALYIIYKLKIKFSSLLLVGVFLGIMLASSWTTIIHSLEKNDQDSSGELTEHVQSMSNVSTDASNLERLNRWSCAWRMFLERPIVGWGPGTYIFQYAPFQLSNEMTIISTNTSSNGNAHSEYIGPLAESGILGTLTFLMIVIVVFYRGSLLYHKLEGERKTVLLFTLLGLFTYVLHGFMNNYLDTDKLSVPFWGFIALIVAMDVNYKKELETKTKEI
ncbi:MAG: O-antigen ligase family protein [Flavobacteriales bacterium]|nr:O-antigen ligase family protein [Flavobacteriales bacterium]MCW8911971.1 O-antigen ligase family protein [Flavobacteriales bacterium]MCW8937081.1 O-antigen ligase family protein [Flavobacteriales bacterium]MCW8941034.1 O-antigen ligase family protein [Flavobacteriales bacterium]MCW8968810.1 O-antigen ligase family protein [Flavobacteriales bacterium]